MKFIVDTALFAHLASGCARLYSGQILPFGNLPLETCAMLQSQLDSTVLCACLQGVSRPDRRSFAGVETESEVSAKRHVQSRPSPAGKYSQQRAVRPVSFRSCIHPKFHLPKYLTGCGPPSPLHPTKPPLNHLPTQVHIVSVLENSSLLTLRPNKLPALPNFLSLITTEITPPTPTTFPLRLVLCSCSRPQNHCLFPVPFSSSTG